VLVVVGGLGQAFFVNDAGPQAEGVVVITGINGEERARRGENFAGLQSGVSGDSNAGMDAAVRSSLHRKRKDERQSFDVTNGFANVFAPKGYDRNSSAGAAKIVLRCYGGAEGIFLRELHGDQEDFVFAPLQAGALKRPEGSRRRGACWSGKTVALHVNGIDFDIRRAGVAEPNRKQG